MSDPCGPAKVIASVATAGPVAAGEAGWLGGGPLTEGGWSTRYAARRIAWHALDHAWEMQDRAEP